MFMLTAFCSSVWAQQKVSGRVTDASFGDPLAGVTVTVKNTTRGTITDNNGQFSIHAANGEELEFSFIGLAKQVVTVSGTTVNVVLAEDTELIDEVLVVGYGQVLKKDATGSVTSLSSEDFNEGPTVAADQLIKGKTAGVQIRSNGGAPGSSSSITIRGTGSLALTNDPLIIVDDVPLASEKINGARSFFDNLNPNDIESMTILKDASATAIYGSRASNGVIIITTKKGKAGQDLKVDFSSVTSISVPTEYVEVMSADQFREFVNTYGSKDDIALLGKHSTDWQDEIYENAMMYDNNLSASGSIGKVPFRASLGYVNQDGILWGDNMSRMSGALNVTPRFFDDNLRVELNIKASSVDNSFANRGAIGGAVTFDPTKPIFNEDGSYFIWKQSPGDNHRYSQVGSNPVMELRERKDEFRVKNYIGNIKFDYQLPFLPSLNLTLNMGYDKTESDGEKGSREGYIFDTPSKIKDHDEEFKMVENKIMDFYATYKKDWNKVHVLSLMGGYSYQSFYDESTKINRSFFSDPAKNTVTKPVPGIGKDVMISFYSRVNYDFKNRYLLTATLRADASSKLNPNDRWGYFPSTSFAWKINEEGFMKDYDRISTLKLRLGYGQMGNVGDLDRYQYLTRYTSSINDKALYQVGDNFYSMYRPEVVNSEIKWEVGKTWNVGLDFGLSEDRFNGTLDFYVKNTFNLLANQKLDPFTNFSSIVKANVGDMRNTGVELTLNYGIIQQEDLSWTIGYNVSFNKNEITRLPTEELIGEIDGGTGNKLQIRRKGEEANAYYVYEQVYDENGKMLEGVFVDRNGDGILSDEDRYVHESPNADVLMGMFTNLRYKNWDLSLSGRASLGNYTYNNVASNNSFIGSAFSNNSLYNRHIDFYNTKVKMGEVSTLLSDHYIQNASFFKLDNITIGYKFNELFDKANLRLYASIQNVLTLTQYKGIDPENDGIDKELYPNPTIFSLGLSLSF